MPEYDLHLCSICTIESLDEFLLLRFSLESYYHVEWSLATDHAVAEYFARDHNVQCDACIARGANYRKVGSEAEATALFTHKISLLQRSITAHGYGFYLDADKLILSPFPPEVLNWCNDRSFDLAVSPHRFAPWALVWEKQVGRYNAGLLLVRSREFLEEWRALISKGGYWLDQKPLELAVDAGSWRCQEFSAGLNVAVWNGLESIHAKGSSIFWEEHEVCSVHIHLLCPPRDENRSYERYIRNLEHLDRSLLASLNPLHHGLSHKWRIARAKYRDNFPSKFGDTN